MPATNGSRARVINGELVTSLDDRRILRLPAERIARLLAVVDDLIEAASRRTDETLVLDAGQTADVLDLEDIVTTRWQDGSAIAARLARLRTVAEIPDVPVPASFAGSLRPYQQHGVNWLRTASSLPRAARSRSPSTAPRPDRRACRDHDLHRADPRHRRDGKPDLAHRRAGRGAGDQKPHGEGNPCGVPAEHAASAVLSGTPIENNLGELWSQFAFLMPGLLGHRKTFNRRFRGPIEKDGNPVRRRQLAARIRPFILRRTKAAVASELPPKHTILRRITLAPDQRELYETIRATMHERVREGIAARGLAQSHVLVLDALLKLRQVCCDPRLVSPLAGRVRGRLVYEHWPMNGPREVLLQDEILHLRGLSLAGDGVLGLSPIDSLREAVGLALAAETYGARFYRNDARPGIVVKHPGRLSPEAHARLKASWNSQFAGAANAHRTAVLEEGMEVVPIGMTAEQAQFLQTRKFQRNEIAAMFGVPPSQDRRPGSRDVLQHRAPGDRGRDRHHPAVGSGLGAGADA